MIKKVILGLCLFGYSANWAQTTLFTEDFSTGTNYTVSLGAEGEDGSSDYFTRTDGSTPNIGISYTNTTGIFFAAQDIDDSGWSGSANPSQLTWTGINISTYTDLEFSGSFASNSTGGIDDNDYLLVEYQIDGGGWTNLLAFENDGAQFNTELGEDTDFDGDSDGTDLTAAFLEFTKSITGTGTTLDLRITVAMNSGNEDVAFDELSVVGTSGGGQSDVSIDAFSNTCIDELTLNWTLPGDYSAGDDQVLVFAKASSAITAATPSTGVGTYTADADFSGSGTVYENDASAKCVYSGD